MVVMGRGRCVMHVGAKGGGGGGGGGGGLPFGRMSEATEEQMGGQPRGGRALRPTISWTEQQTAGAIPAPDKAFVDCLGTPNMTDDVFVTLGSAQFTIRCAWTLGQQ